MPHNFGNAIFTQLGFILIAGILAVFLYGLVRAVSALVVLARNVATGKLAKDADGRPKDEDAYRNAQAVKTYATIVLCCIVAAPILTAVFIGMAVAIPIIALALPLVIVGYIVYEKITGRT